MKKAIVSLLVAAAVIFSFSQIAMADWWAPSNCVIDAVRVEIVSGVQTCKVHVTYDGGDKWLKFWTSLDSTEFSRLLAAVLTFKAEGVPVKIQHTAWQLTGVEGQ